MMMLGEKISAAKALEWGLINRVVPRAEIENAALEIAGSLAAGPTRALGEIRKSCWHALEANFEEQLSRDRIIQCELGKTIDHKEAISAFFDKRPAHFKGR